MRRFLIDTDTASDDAVALVMALREPTISIDAITVVAGNVPLDQAVQNALYTVELCGSDVPVFAGQPGPLMRVLQTAEDVHGNDGMGDIGRST
jgi:purine nucleosidase